MRIEIIETVPLGTQHLAAGVQVDLDAERAKELIESGHARPLDPMDEAQSMGAPDPDGEGRHELIVAAIRDLIEADPERADETYWTKSGKPDLKALETLVGFEFTAADRDAAWNEVNG